LVKNFLFSRELIPREQEFRPIVLYLPKI